MDTLGAKTPRQPQSNTVVALSGWTGDQCTDPIITSTSTTAAPRPTVTTDDDGVTGESHSFSLLRVRSTQCVDMFASSHPRSFHRVGWLTFTKVQLRTGGCNFQPEVQKMSRFSFQKSEQTHTRITCCRTPCPNGVQSSTAPF